MDAFSSYNPTSSAFGNKRHIVILLTAIAVAILLIIGAIWFIRVRQERALREIADRAATEAVEEKLVDEIARCDLSNDPTVCKAEKVSSAALKTEAVSLCERLEENSRDRCLQDFALSKNSQETCKLLSAEAQSGCEDAFVWKKARAETSFRACASITSEETRGKCENEMTLRVIAAGTCEKEGVDQVNCDDAQVVRQAVLAQDFALCDRLSSSVRIIVCKALVGDSDADVDGLMFTEEGTSGSDPKRSDSDSDGLSDAEEVHVWKTDPTKSDTDGDGFSDKIEVDGGYNPLGPGKQSTNEV